MAQWVTVAEGTNLLDLTQTVADMELIKGTKIRAVIDLTLPLGWAFDVAGAELIFQPFMPEGVDLVDVYGEGSKGYVDMEADPVWLVAFLAFLKAHWLAITIAGLALTAIIAFITILVKFPVVAQVPIWLILGAVAGVALLVVVGTRAGYTVRRRT